jgi:hypothetical protein
MTDRIQVNAKRILSISRSLITATVLAQNVRHQTTGEGQLNPDQSELEVHQNKLARDEAGFINGENLAFNAGLYMD